MGAGIPGTGMATLFYILSVLVMPLTELVRTVRGRSSWQRWGLIARHYALALAMTAAVYGTFQYLPGALLPPDATIGGVSALAFTVLLYVAYLIAVNLLAALWRGQLEVPISKAFPERRKVLRSEERAPAFHPDRLAEPPRPTTVDAPAPTIAVPASRSLPLGAPLTVTPLSLSASGTVTEVLGREPGSTVPSPRSVVAKVHARARSVFLLAMGQKAAVRMEHAPHTHYRDAIRSP